MIPHHFKVDVSLAIFGPSTVITLIFFCLIYRKKISCPRNNPVEKLNMLIFKAKNDKSTLQLLYNFNLIPYPILLMDIYSENMLLKCLNLPTKPLHGSRVLQKSELLSLHHGLSFVWVCICFTSLSACCSLHVISFPLPWLRSQTQTVISM